MSSLRERGRGPRPSALRARVGGVAPFADHSKRVTPERALVSGIGLAPPSSGSDAPRRPFAVEPGTSRSVRTRRAAVGRPAQRVLVGLGGREAALFARGDRAEPEVRLVARLSAVYDVTTYAGACRRASCGSCTERSAGWVVGRSTPDARLTGGRAGRRGRGARRAGKLRAEERYRERSGTRVRGGTKASSGSTSV